MKHTVAVYGSLRAGFGNHRLLRDAGDFKRGVTMESHTMYSLGAFPAITEEEHPEGKGVIVEVYEVDDTGFARLDGLEGYPSFYNRKQTDILLDTGDIVEAWIYYFSDHKPYSMDTVECNDWRVFNS